MPYVKFYINDVVVGYRCLAEHLSHLIELCSRSKENWIKIQPSKCEVTGGQIEVLEYDIRKSVLKPDPRKPSCFPNTDQPEPEKEVRSQVMFCSFDRKFVSRFAHFAAIVHSPVGEERKFQCKEGTVNAFNTLKVMLSKRIVLVLPSFTQSFQVFMDASEEAVGTALMQDMITEKGERLSLQSVVLPKLRTATEH